MLSFAVIATIMQMYLVYSWTIWYFVFRIYSSKQCKFEIGYERKQNFLYGSSTNSEALPGVLGNRWKRGIYFRGTGEQRPNFEGNKDNIGEQGT